MRNGLGRAAPENAELAFSGDFAAIGETDFELFRYNLAFANNQLQKFRGNQLEERETNHNNPMQPANFHQAENFHERRAERDETRERNYADYREEDAFVRQEARCENGLLRACVEGVEGRRPA